jgi:hypothetical protein
MVLWSRRIFTERLPEIATPRARRTDRLRAWLLHLAFAMRGEGGARVLQHCGIAACGDTVLAHLRAWPVQSCLHW